MARNARKCNDCSDGESGLGNIVAYIYERAIRTTTTTTEHKKQKLLYPTMKKRKKKKNIKNNNNNLFNCHLFLTAFWFYMEIEMSTTFGHL